MNTERKRLSEISVAIVEDHKVLSDALEMVLQNEPGYTFLGAAKSITAAQEMLPEIHPDVILLDIHLPDGDGLDLIPFIHDTCPDSNIVILTSYSDENTLRMAIDRGVNGFISKDSSLPDLITTIQKAATGEIVMPTSLLLGLVMRVSRDDAAAYQTRQGWEPLTPRENQVLGFLARGKTGSRIAAELHITPYTVRTHIRNLMAKLRVHSRLEAVVFGIRHGLVDPPV